MLVLIPVVIFIFYFIVNIFGASSSILGGDSGDIVFSYYFGGIPHPPGYPLNTILGWIIAHLLIGNNFVYRANLVSSVYASLSLVLVYLSLKLITKNNVLSFASSFVLGFVSLFWLYSHVAEVFPLLILLTLLSIYFIIRWEANFNKNKAISRDLVVSIVFFGLAVFHHHTALLLFPAYFYIFLSKGLIKAIKFKNAFLLIAAFLGGLLPYLFIPLTAMRQTPENWSNVANFNEFARLITRADYGTFLANKNIIGFSAQERIFQLKWYFGLVKNDFTLVGLFFIFVGLFYLYRQNRRFFWFFLLAVVFTGPFFLVYASFPITSSFLQGVSERFVLVNYPLIAILLGFGMVYVYEFLSKYFKNTANGRIFSTVFLFSFLFFPMSLFFFNFPKTNLTKTDEGSYLARDILRAAEPPGFVFLQGDSAAFNTRYAYFAEKQNRSIFIVPSRLRYYNYRQEIKHRYAYLNFPASFDANKPLEDGFVLAGLISLNFEKYPTYSIVSFPFGDEYTWISQGMLKRLYKKDHVPSNQELRDKIVNNLDNLEFDEKKTASHYVNFFTQEIVETYMQIFDINANELIKLGFLDDAQKYFSRARSLDQKDENSLVGLSTISSKKGECGQALEYANKILEFNDKSVLAYEKLTEVSKDCLKDDDKAEVYSQKAKRLKDVNLEKKVDEL